MKNPIEKSADNILQLLGERSKIDTSDLRQINSDALTLLIKEGYVIRYYNRRGSTESYNYCSITSKGRNFLYNGGYKKISKSSNWVNWATIFTIIGAIATVIGLYIACFSSAKK